MAHGKGVGYQNASENRTAQPARNPILQRKPKDAPEEPTNPQWQRPVPFRARDYFPNSVGLEARREAAEAEAEADAEAEAEARAELDEPHET